jgi:hypothetical protein
MDELLRELRNVLRSLAAAPYEMTARPYGEQWELHLTAPRRHLPTGMTATIELLTDRGRGHALEADDDVELVLGPVALDEVTPFLIVRLHALGPAGEELTRATVVRARLNNDPEDRLDEILARQVDTPEKFIRFLLLLLGLAQGVLVLGDETDGEGTGTWAGFGTQHGLFELIVRAATDRPEVVADLDRMVSRLRRTERGRAVLPPGFDELWAVVEAAAPGLAAVQAAGTAGQER